eukprot:EG_transcript_35905
MARSVPRTLSALATRWNSHRAVGRPPVPRPSNTRSAIPRRQRRVIHTWRGIHSQFFLMGKNDKKKAKSDLKERPFLATFGRLWSLLPPNAILAISRSLWATVSPF